MVRFLIYRLVISFWGDANTGLSLNDYIDGVNELSSVTDIIIPADDKQSMLTAMFNVLEAVSKAFPLLSVTSDSITRRFRDRYTIFESAKRKRRGCCG